MRPNIPRTVTLRDLPAPGAYARAWRRVVTLADTDPRARVHRPGTRDEVTAAELRDEMRRAMDRRIQARAGLEVGDGERLQRLRHDQRVLDDARRGIRWPGRNILADARMARRFPDVHNPGTED